MRALILTEAGKEIGFGHIARCMALYEGFKEKGIIPEIIMNGDETAKELLRGIDCSVFNWATEKEKTLNIINTATIAVIDSYLADFGLYKEISEKVKVPVYIDDNQRIDYPKGVVVNGCIFAEELNYKRRDGTIYLLGCQYMPIRKEFWAAPGKRIKAYIESIMVTFGGCDPRHMTLRVLECLNQFYPEIVKKVVIGRGFKNTEGIERLKNERTDLIYYPDAESMKALMLACDASISAAGQTLYEFARIGIPAVAIAVAKNQLNNIKGFQKSGCIEYVGWYNDKNLFKKLEKFSAILDYKKREAMSRIGQKFVDGQGARRVVEEILNFHVTMIKK